MDERLKELCREVSEIIREKYNPDATITIRGNSFYEVVYGGCALKPDEDIKDALKFEANN